MAMKPLPTECKCDAILASERDEAASATPQKQKKRHTIFRNGHSTGNFHSQVPPGPENATAEPFFAKECHPTR